jgi:hypothetical protein
LIALISNAHRFLREVMAHTEIENLLASPASAVIVRIRGVVTLRPAIVLGRPGGISEEPVPDPIPNSAVKLLCADGTKSQGLEE